jgi:alginate O-acetyltransferase complex protein AlgI
MLFPTFGFLVFFLAVFIGFWYIFRRNLERRIFLIAASYLFYAFWDWRFCILLLASTAANYGFALLIGRSHEHIWRKTFLVLSVVFNLLLLGFFKYYNFFADSANSLIQMAAAGGEGSSLRSGFLFPSLRVILPVGISFYTFKAMSYVFDVYLCSIPPVKSFLDVMLYVSFFPQIASGPIVHAKDFLPQIRPCCDAGRDPEERPIEFDRAALLVMRGLLKKMVFANFLSTLFVDQVLSNPSQYGTLEMLLASIGYSVVIYCDFSGYSDMAIGIALFLGFRTPKNFDRPYISRSVTEFWKRWHITFSSWLREYLYFSFGGSRFGLARTLFGLFATMILGGLWHGASLTFIVWGALQGFMLVVERAFSIENRKSDNVFVIGLRIFFTFAFTTFCWIIFRSSSLGDVLNILVAFGRFSADTSLVTPVVATLLVLGLAMNAVPARVQGDAFKIWRALPLVVKGILIALFFAGLSVVSMSGVAPFIYFQF